VMGLIGAAIAWRANVVVAGSDLDEGLAAARWLWAGADPYSHVGPGLASPWPWPIYYPLPALVLEMPFAVLSDGAAHILFVAISSAVLAWAVMRTGSHRMVLFASVAFLSAAERTQWTPILVAAYLVPSLGFVYAAKPNVGVALWGARPSRAAVLGCIALVAVSFALDPGWLVSWIHASPMAAHLRPAVGYPFGWLLLLAALRWRRREARLLLLFALIPQTLAEYAVLPLFLVAETRLEAIVLALGTVAATVYIHGVHHVTTDMDYIATSGQALVLACFLPCLAMVLRRPNVGALPAWLERLLARSARAVRSAPTHQHSSS